MILRVAPDRSNFQQNWDFQAEYYGQVEAIIKENAMQFIKITVADEEADRKRATDFVVTVEGGEVAVRIRRNTARYRDLTIRSFNNGFTTEIHKIKQGFGRFYLYCWEDPNRKLAEWILVDLDSLRQSGLLEGHKEIANTDGKTRFIAIGWRELEANSCLVASQLATN